MAYNKSLHADAQKARAREFKRYELPQMRNLIFILIFFIYTPLLKADCDLKALTEYKLILINDNEKSIYESKVYLPQIDHEKRNFCGYWSQESLTNNEMSPLSGYVVDDALSIDLYPNSFDWGYELEFDNNKNWEQEGTLIRKGIAGVIVGKFKIVPK